MTRILRMADLYAELRRRKQLDVKPTPEQYAALYGFGTDA